ncbi:MAG TPA: TauD/TfdA family dioxygenase, partial [Trebonia sp.]
MNGFERARADLAERGWAVLRGQRFRADQASVLRIARHFGRPSARDGGQAVWEVRPRPGRARGTFSERTGPAAFHTDAQYHARPEDLVCLFVVRPAADGGHTRVLSAEAALSTLRAATLTALREPTWSWTVPEV